MTDFTDITNTVDISIQPHLFDEYPNEFDDSTAIVDVTPAVAVALTGRHLIEASAGTGKTWTLTGIVLRLLIEARRAPEQIIATTFTRAAAAEMRQRIHDRLVEFYQLLQWVNNLSANTNNKDNLYPSILQVLPDSDDNNKGKPEGNDSSIDSNAQTDVDEFNQDIEHDKQIVGKKREQVKEERGKWLIEQAEYVRLDDIMQDPVNLHLVGYLLDHVYSYPMAEAIRRTALVLTTLDKLFVGTLDSLAQKWLKEYSSETDAVEIDNAEARTLNSFSYALRDKQTLEGVILTENTAAINFRNFLLSSTGQDILEKYDYYNIEGYKNSVDDLFNPTSRAQKTSNTNTVNVADALSNGE